MRLLQILDLANQTRFLLRKAGIPLEVVLGEAAGDFVDDKLGFRTHDPQFALATGEVVVGKGRIGIQTVYTPQIVQARSGITATRSLPAAHC